MIVLGIDPGSRTTGYGVVRAEGNHLTHIDNGGIQPKAGLSLPQRLRAIHDHLASLISTFHPEIVALEDIFVANNARSAMALGHARGIAMLAADQAGLEVSSYTPSQVKLAVVGFGGATKQQIQEMTRMMLKLPEVPQEDAADALAVALCHCQSAGFAHRVKQAEGKR
ncbi:MAG: crossover junction endodeoxyribonuclease RuvC [Deltaproteobacteria bacterium]|nr:crossover junction endodeoxyribonuclease RuvC [Deltaproteobacteria bacterium]